MILEIYNSLTKDLAEIALDPTKEVTIYCCGVTVYDHCHVGHGRIYTLLDTLTRFLRSAGLELKVIRNITDIDDKIIKKASETGTSWDKIAQKYTASMQKVLHEGLGCLPVTVEPRATEAISDMIAMIEQMIAQGHAYVVEGEVFFATASFKNYGCLSGQKLSQLYDGQRVAVHDAKRQPSDFTLWKPSKEGEPAWNSPWGPGRPGWHIECSAMIAQHVKAPLDFHLGGMDLKFPHHDNEIAQSESCHHYPLARCWVHGGFVTVNEEKMSKSLGNFQYLDDIIARVGRDAMRYFYLSTHYRQPLELTSDKLTQAQNSLAALEQAIMPYCPQHIPERTPVLTRITEALQSDLNTPKALALFHEAAKNLKELEEPSRGALAAQLWVSAKELFGIELRGREKMTISAIPAQVQELLSARQQAKQQKDFQQADAIRAQLAQQGYQVVDTATGYDVLPIKKS